MRHILSFCLLGYHAFVSPWLPRACRFYPTCSVYAANAIQKHGLMKGVSMGLTRLIHCHPWNPGGYDPVH